MQKKQPYPVMLVSETQTIQSSFRLQKIFLRRLLLINQRNHFTFHIRGLMTILLMKLMIKLSWLFLSGTRNWDAFILGIYPL